MFGLAIRKAAEVTALEATVAAQGAELAELQGDLILGVAARMVAGVAAMQGENGLPLTGTALDGAVTELIQTEEAALIASKAAPLAAERIAARTDEEKARITAAAEAKADTVAASALKLFLEGGEADRYRRDQEAELTQDRTGEVLAAAREKIRKEELEKAAMARKAKLDAAEAADRALWPRANEIRDRAAITKVIKLEQLEPGDVLTIDFTALVFAFHDRLAPPHIRRTVQVRLINKETELFEVQADSWFEDDKTREQAMWGGSPCHLATDDPTTAKVEEVSAIVQGKGLAFISPDSDAVDRTSWAVGAVRLGSHFVVGGQV